MELILKLFRVVAERDQHFLKLIRRCRHFKAEEIQPFFIDVAHAADRLNGFLSGAQLLDPRKRPDVSFGVGAHRFVFRVFVKYSLQVRHTGINIVFERNDRALFAIL